MSDTEKKKVVGLHDILIIDMPQLDFMPDSYKLNMVKKLLDDAPSLPLFKLSDRHGKVGEFPPHCICHETIKKVLKL